MDLLHLAWSQQRSSDRTAEGLTGEANVVSGRYAELREGGSNDQPTGATLERGCYGSAWWSFIGATLMSVSLMRVSGVTLLEKGIGEDQGMPSIFGVAMLFFRERPSTNESNTLPRSDGGPSAASRPSGPSRRSHACLQAHARALAGRPQLLVQPGGTARQNSTVSCGVGLLPGGVGAWFCPARRGTR